MLILGYLLDIPHSLQITAYGFLVYTILKGKLLQRLLALYIIGYNLGFVSANTAYKLPSAVLAFIQMLTASQAIPDHILRAAEKAFFLAYQ
jgi:hypothetical protein